MPSIGASQNGDLLTACEIVRTCLGRPAFITALLASYSQKRFQFSRVHENLVALDSRIVLTTNFDKLYENAANSILHGDILTKTYTDREIADVIRRQNRCIIKVHGSIDTPGEAILTRADYAKARNVHNHFYRVMDALFMTHTFVFLGASMRDPDIALVLEDYAHRYQPSRPHYVVMPSESLSVSELHVLEECLNLKAIRYSSADNHHELIEGIEKLKGQVDSARSGLLDTMDW